jgi:predicted DNA-binding protein
MQYTIKLKIETKKRLKALGHKDQSYDEIVNEILDRKEYGEDQ